MLLVASFSDAQHQREKEREIEFCVYDPGTGKRKRDR